MSGSEEIIILRRVEAEPEGKKGGVWKIAHADFMTAMMAFFLIMWLVNATDEEIKKSIANYFNPINLIDAPSDRRGVMTPDEDTRPTASGEEDGKTSSSEISGAQTPGTIGTQSGGGNVEEGNDRRMSSAGILAETDGAAFDDPYAALASAAADLELDEAVAVDVPQSTRGEIGETVDSTQQRDPFDPAYWQTTSSRPAQTLRPGLGETLAQPSPSSVVDAADRRPTADLNGGGEAPVSIIEAPSAGNAGPDVVPAGNAADEAGAAARPLSAVGPRSATAEAILAEHQRSLAKAEASADAEVTDAGTTGGSTAEASEADSLAKAAEEIAAALTEADTAKVKVSEGERSVLISLTDDGQFSMFDIGSAKPTDEASALFQRLAGTLAARAGTIVVRGHTDGRQFRDNTSDNWLLSFARAYATQQALVRAGVDEARIARVEGLADRELTRPEDPLADENRRIEILYHPAESAT